MRRARDDEPPRKNDRGRANRRRNHKWENAVTDAEKQDAYRARRKTHTDALRMPDNRDLRTLAEIREEQEQNRQIEKQIASQGGEKV